MRANKKRASITVYVFALIIILLAFSAFAIDGTIVFTQRLKLQNITEMTAISAASEFNYSLNATELDIETKVTQQAEDTFNLLKKDGLQFAKINVFVKTSPKNVLVKTSMIAKPIFLTVLGVNGINLEAKACASSEEKFVQSNYGGVNWLNASAVYLSDILSKTLNLNDTAILLPLGEFPSASYSTRIVMFDLINAIDSKPLSLGPGGFITIKLPAPMVDKPGPDLFIKEAGDAIEGYMVFAGIDNNPKKPYVQKDNEGDGISWVNITKYGKPDTTDTNNFLGVYETTTDGLSGTQNKIYGSAYFDLENSGISMVKYIRIIDDNDESAFVSNTPGTYYKAMMYGESSSATAGADIDAVKMLNYVELKPSSEF